MLSIGYIRRNRDGNKQLAIENSQSIMGICVGNNPESDRILFYLPTSKKLVGPADYLLDLYVLSGPVLVYSYDGGIGLNIYNSSTNATRPPAYKK